MRTSCLAGDGFTWKDGSKLRMENQLVLAVQVKEAVPSSNASPACGTIQIELAKGTIRIVGMADPGSLHAVLEYLTR